MNFTKTISELTQWIESCSKKSEKVLLNINKSDDEYCIEREKKSSFLGRLWNKAFAFFGWGNTALSKVVAIVRESLVEYSKQEVEIPPFLKKSIKCLNGKIEHYETRKFLWIFPLPRPHIRPLNVPTSHKVIDKEPVSGTERSEGPSSAPVVIRRGICNEGNTCFAAATIQALLACGKEIHDEKLRTFMESVKKGSSKPVKGIKGLLEYIFKKSWDWKLGDPENVLHTLFPDMQGLFQQRFDDLPAHASIQDMVDGLYLRNKKPKRVQSDQSLFVVNIIGRCSGATGEYDDMPVTVPPCISIATDQETRKEYRMAGVIMYVNVPRHYYLLEPVYDPQGKITEWVEYNDSFASRHPNSEAIHKRLSSYGYMFFYRKIFILTEIG